MADYWIKRLTGSDAGDGSSGSPWLTWSKVISAGALIAGNRFFLAEASSENITITDVSNVELRQWAGQTQWGVDNRTTISGWTLDTGTTYYATLSGATAVWMVVIDWDTATKHASGDYQCGLTPAASVAACRAATNSFYHDTAANRLYVNNGTGSPAAQVVQYCLKADGIKVEGTASLISGVVVDGPRVTLAGDGASLYGIKFTNATGCVLKNHTCVQCGWHGTGFVSYGAFDCTGNTESDGTIWGSNYDSCCVAYSQAGAVRHRWDRMTLYCWTIRDRAGAPISIGGSRKTHGFAAHNTTGNGVQDIAVYDSRIVFYDDGSSATQGYPVLCKNTDTAFASVDDPWAYPVRVYRTTIVNAWANVTQPTSQAYIGCTIGLELAGKYGDSNGKWGHDGTNNGLRAYAFRDCYLKLNLDNASATVALFLVRNDTRYLFDGCTMYDAGVDTSTTREHRLFVYTSASATAYVKRLGTVFGFREPTAATTARRLAVGDSALTPITDYHRGNDNAYLNVGTYSSAATFNTNFYTSYETQSVNLATSNPLADAAGGTAAIKRSSTLWTRRRRQARTSRPGFAGKFATRIGSDQPRPTRRRRVAAVRAIQPT